MDKVLKKYWPIFILILLPLLFFYPIFFGYIPFPGEVIQKQFYPWKDYKYNDDLLPWEAKTYWGSDPFIAHYPWKLIGLELIKKGVWPLWNQYSFGGSPLLANHQSAFYYPLNIVYLILPLPIGWGVLSLSQPLLASLFFYLFIRSFRVSKYASVFGSLIYGWNSFVGGYFHIQVIGHTLIWLPLSLYCIKKLQNSLSKKWVILFIFSMICILLAGHLQIALYSLFIVLLFSLTSGLRIFVCSFLSMILAFSLTAFQLLPTIDYLQKASRIQSELYTTFDFLLSPLSLLRLIAPRYYGHPTTDNFWLNSLPVEYVYIGLLGMLFFLIGVYWSIENRKNIFWLFLSFGILIFSIDNIFSRFFYELNIPFLKSVTPSRGFGMMILPLAILSAFGLDVFLLGFKKIKKSIYITSLILTLILIFSYFWGKNNLSLTNFLVISNSLRIPLFLMFIWFCILMIHQSRIWGFIAVMSLIFFVQAADLLHEFKPLTRSFTYYQSFYPETDLTTYLQKSEDRFLSLDLWLLLANSFLPYKLSSITNYDAIHLPGSLRLVDSIFQETNQLYPFDSRSIRYSNFNKNLADILNIHFFLSLKPLNITGIKLIEKMNSIYIYENMTYLPKAFLVSNIEVLNSQIIGQRLNDSTLSLDKNVYLEEDPNTHLNEGESSVEILRDNYNYEMKVNTTSNQLLFISESYDEGWNAFVDGERTKIYKANLAFQGVVIKRGEHQVKLVYLPKSFEYGLFISKLAFGIALIFLVVIFGQVIMVKKIKG